MNEVTFWILVVLAAIAYVLVGCGLSTLGNRLGNWLADLIIGRLSERAAA